MLEIELEDWRLASVRTRRHSVVQSPRVPQAKARFPRRDQRSGAVARDAFSALAETARRIHIPAAP